MDVCTSSLYIGWAGVPCVGRERARPTAAFWLIIVTPSACASQPTLMLSVCAWVCVCYLLKVVIVQLQFSY